MRKPTTILLLLVHCLLSATNVPQEVAQAISEALTGKWAFQHFDKNKVSMGFDSTTQLSDIEAGEPFSFYYISQIDLEKSDAGVAVDSLAAQGSWYAPLYVTKELIAPAMLIRARPRAEGKWSVRIESQKQLVHTWLRIQQAWPESKGFHPRLVMIAEAPEKSVCFNVPEAEEPNLTLIGKFFRRFTPVPGKTDFTTLCTSEETLKAIKARRAESRRLSDSLWSEKMRVNDSLANLKDLATRHLWGKHEMKGNTEPLIPDSAIISLWNNMLVAADSAVIPQNMRKQELQAHKPKEYVEISPRVSQEYHRDGTEIDRQIQASAQPLRVEGPPIDRKITKETDHWYVLFAQDGSGIVRIGTTGPLLLIDAPYKEGQKWGPGGMRASYNKPQKEADLIEISTLSPSHFAIRWSVEKAFLRIHTESEEQIHYRISFVSELPIQRTGGRHGPGVAAEHYIMAVAHGDLTDLYRTTRTKYSITDIENLRTKLFGIDNFFHIGSTRRKPGALEANAEAKLHVQHIIVAERRRGERRRGWAFEIICMKRDGLWLVADAYRDPELSDTQVDDIVNHSFHRLNKRR